MKVARSAQIFTCHSTQTKQISKEKIGWTQYHQIQYNFIRIKKGSRFSVSMHLLRVFSEKSVKVNLLLDNNAMHRYLRYVIFPRFWACFCRPFLVSLVLLRKKGQRKFTSTMYNPFNAEMTTERPMNDNLR